VLVSELVSRITIYTGYSTTTLPNYHSHHTSISNNVKRICSIHSLFRRQDPRWQSKYPFHQHTFYTDFQPIGWYLPEAAHPYHALSNDFEIVGASPKGGQAPVDQNSVENLMDDQGRFFLDDKKAQKVWKETIKISEVKASDFKAIFVVGGVRLLSLFSGLS
jgi:hypothetical protein